MAAPGYEERWAMRLSAEQTLKLICLFEIFGLPGCAGELVLMKKRELGGWINADEVLDTLARQIHPGATGFAKAHRRFPRP